jgi:signal recognition particle subunit SRP14
VKYRYIAFLPIEFIAEIVRLLKKPTMVLLENEAFLSELTKLFIKAKTKGSGSVTVTMKRYDGRTKPDPRKENTKNAQNKKKKDGKKATSASAATKSVSSVTQDHPGENTCLFHGKLGNSKISTVVHAKDVNKFQLAYCIVLKGNMDAFKKIRKKLQTAVAAAPAIPAKN